MKQAVMKGPREAAAVEVSDPRVADNYALVKVHCAPLCTEYKGWEQSGEQHGFGHEAAGEVVEIGPKVTSVAVGDRVVVMPQNACGICDLCTSGEHIYCQSPRKALEICGSETGMCRVAQYTIQQDWLLWRVADDLSYDHASMACCGLGPAFNAMQAMNVTATDTVLVSGLGPVGLGAAVIACYRGARVLGLEMNPYRVELAKTIGVENVIDPSGEDAHAQIMALTEGKGVDKSIECSSVAGAPAFLVSVARHRGHIATPGWGGPVDFSKLTGKGLTVHGCWHWNHQRDGATMERTIRGAAALIDKQITHTFSMDRIRESLELQDSGQCGKVMIHPWE